MDYLPFLSQFHKEGNRGLSCLHNFPHILTAGRTGILASTDKPQRHFLNYIILAASNADPY